MGPDGPSLRTIIARHKRETAVVVALVIVLIGTMAATALPSSRATALSDTSTCSEWASGGQSQQAAYARLYVTEYAGSRSSGSIESALNSACTHAAYLGEADDISLVAAMNHAF
jgi:hypothetical protein